MNVYRTFAALSVLVALVLGACVYVPAPASRAIATITPVSVRVATAVPVAAAIPDLDKGQNAWKEARCADCHGPLALGGIGRALASSRLSYDEFLRVVRSPAGSMPAYDASALPDRSVYDIYAWVRTQLPLAQVTAEPVSVGTGQQPQPDEMLGMTIWTSKKCNTCHGVFAQGSATGPALASLNEPVDRELLQMRSTAVTIPGHNTDSISDATFERLYQWLKMGCLESECSQ